LNRKFQNYNYFNNGEREEEDNQNEFSLSTFSQKLKKIAVLNNLVVLCTNQITAGFVEDVTSKYGGGVVSEGGVDSIKSQLGMSWLQFVNVRLLLSYGYSVPANDVPLGDPNSAGSLEEEEEGGGGTGKGGGVGGADYNRKDRTITIMKSNGVRVGSCVGFEVFDGGVRNL